MSAALGFFARLRGRCLEVRFVAEPEPCLVCGAPVIRELGHDPGCLLGDGADEPEELEEPAEELDAGPGWCGEPPAGMGWSEWYAWNNID